MPVKVNLSKKKLPQLLNAMSNSASYLTLRAANWSAKHALGETVAYTSHNANTDKTIAAELMEAVEKLKTLQVLADQAPE